MICKGAKVTAQHEQALGDNAEAVLTFTDHWNEADVRGALYAMHGWVCAYCQCGLPRNDRGDVEHYRPKDGGDDKDPRTYWWLAYEFDNYFLACRVCNSGRKRGRFPLAAGASPVTYSTRADLVAETRLLVDPARDPVEHWMRVDWMDPDKPDQIRTVPGLPGDGFPRQRATQTIQFFRLNDDCELYRERHLALDAVRRALKENKREAARQLASRYRAHGMAARNILEEFVHPPDPSWLPSPREEFEWFLDEVHERLTNALHLLATEPGAELWRIKMIKELCWTLAVLWKDPPPETLSSDELAVWLEEKDHRRLVEPFHRQLT